jgi:hypothetical protein
MTSQYVTAEGKKRCAKCRELRPIEDFPANEQLSTGLSPWCRSCHREATRKSREKYRNRYNAARRKPKRARFCEECGEPFETAKSHQRFCCVLHRKRADSRRQRQRRDDRRQAA